MKRIKRLQKTAEVCLALATIACIASAVILTGALSPNLNYIIAGTTLCIASVTLSAFSAGIYILVLDLQKKFLQQEQETGKPSGSILPHN